jgi:two-component system, NtrC family, response regulator HydG
MIELAADSMANVLVHGESGTGKELIAEAIHLLGDRKDENIVKVNCSALTESLLESELFGHVKGSFTNAVKDKKGKFEEAHKGTIFLDEIGEISHSIQVKLLRVIQEKTIERVGDNKSIKVDMRIVAATNKDLRQLVNEGKFREDLFYRLNVFPIRTLALRDHKNDIPLLCNHFIEKFNRQTGKNIRGLSQDAWRILLDYCWPGNVRELENAIEHAFVLCQDELIDVFDLPQEVRLVTLREGLCKGLEQAGDKAYAFRPAEVSIKSQSSPEKESLLQLLQRHHGNRNRSAAELGISRVALWKKLKKHGISEK